MSINILPYLDIYCLVQSNHGDGGKRARSILDFIGRIVFPITFVLFTIVFWVAMTR